MIIECINCGKKFDVNSDLIPSEGRTIQCGSCNHVWFFTKKDHTPLNFSKPSTKNEPAINDIEVDQIKKEPKKNQNEEVIIQKKIKEDKKIKGSEIVEYQSKSNFTFSNFLAYIIVLIISFVGLLLLVDTFKFQLYGFYPDLEYLLYNFYETLKDIQLFIKDLI